MLKILTLNLNYDQDGFGSWDLRRERIVALLRDEHPQLVALQAVCARPDCDQARELAERLDYPHKLFMAARESEPERGCAILSRIPLSAPWSYALPRTDSDEDPSFRRAMGATFAWQGEVWQFTNVHCSWVPNQNHAQTAALARALSVFPGPQCLAGDFNAPPDAAGIRVLTQSAWLDSHAASPRPPGPTFPADNPQTRIDYIFVNGVAPQRILDARPAPNDGPPLSDHKAYLLTLGVRAAS